LSRSLLKKRPKSIGRMIFQDNNFFWVIEYFSSAGNVFSCEDFGCCCFPFFLLMLWLQKRKKSIGAHYFTHTLMMMFCSEWMPNIGTICIYMCLLGKEFCNFSTKGNDFFICNLFLFVLFGKKTWGIVTIFSFFFLCYKSFTKGRLNFLGYCSELQIVLQQVDFCFSFFS